MDTGKSYSTIPEPRDALLAVDVQNDFLPGGNLGVPKGDRVVPALNRCIDIFRRKELPIYASRDWHPKNHCSFKEQGGIWPAHCVADSPGAEFAPGLDLPPSSTVISKAALPDADVYSAFEGTDLETRLRAGNIRRLFVGGLATDYCVLSSVKDACKLGFEVVLLEDCIRPVNVNPEDGANAVNEMLKLGVRLSNSNEIGINLSSTSALLTDLYQLAMIKSYFDEGMTKNAVFEFFVRQLPPERGFLMMAGLEQVLQFLETFQFTDQDLDGLRQSGRFDENFIETLTDFRFTGDVDAFPEGNVFFANEPVLRVRAPLPQAQLMETRIINLLQYQILIASKAARMVLTAPGKTLMDFGLRRAHGSEAGLLAARASYLAGFSGTSNVMAEPVFGIPIFGTMAHSYIQAHDDEEKAFENFTRSWPENSTLLIDTYDTEQGAKKVVALAKRLAEKEIFIKGVRLDSGDLKWHARNVRDILDEAELYDIRIFASGNLDEYALQDLISHQAPIDGFGIGTRLTVSADAPYLDCVYKIQEYDNKPQRKRSEGKSTWPGSKQVFRQKGNDGMMVQDVIALSNENVKGEHLLKPVMREGKRLRPPVSLEDSRIYAAGELSRLPEPLKSLKPNPEYPVQISQAIKDMADSLDAEKS